MERGGRIARPRSEELSRYGLRERERPRPRPRSHGEAEGEFRGQFAFASFARSVAAHFLIVGAAPAGDEPRPAACLCKNSWRCLASRNASVPPARVTESAPAMFAYFRQSSNLVPRMN